MISSLLVGVAAIFFVRVSGDAHERIMSGECVAGNSEVDILSLTVELNTGSRVPRIGFGTAGLGDRTEEAVTRAFAAGYRHVDTAQASEWYREEKVGRSIRIASAAATHAASGSEAGVSIGQVTGDDSLVDVARDELFVTTKLHPRDFEASRAGAMVDASIRHLSGVDLLLLHSPQCWPGSCPKSPTSWQEAWKTLERFYAEGRVQAIGVSNFSEGDLRELLAMAETIPAVVQNWMDPFHQDTSVRKLCSEHGIVYTAYSTLGGQWKYRTNPPGPNPVSSSLVLNKIAEEHRISPQLVALSWALQNGAIVLPRSSDANRIRQNLEAFVRHQSCSYDGMGSEELLIYASTDRPVKDTRSEGKGLAVFLSQEEMGMIAALDGVMGN